MRGAGRHARRRCGAKLKPRGRGRPPCSLIGGRAPARAVLAQRVSTGGLATSSLDRRAATMSIAGDGDADASPLPVDRDRVGGSAGSSGAAGPLPSPAALTADSPAADEPRTAASRPRATPARERRRAGTSRSGSLPRCSTGPGSRPACWPPGCRSGCSSRWRSSGTGCDSRIPSCPGDRTSGSGC